MIAPNNRIAEFFANRDRYGMVVKAKPDKEAIDQEAEASKWSPEQSAAAKKLADNLSRWLDEQYPGKSVQEFASATGVSYKSIYNYKTIGVPHIVPKLKTLCGYIGIVAESLYEDEVRLLKPPTIFPGAEDSAVAKRKFMSAVEQLWMNPQHRAYLQQTIQLLINSQRSSDRETERETAG